LGVILLQGGGVLRLEGRRGHLLEGVLGDVVLLLETGLLREFMLPLVGVVFLLLLLLLMALLTVLLATLLAHHLPLMVAMVVRVSLPLPRPAAAATTAPAGRERAHKDGAGVHHLILGKQPVVRDDD
jgi:hypothetical protein